MIKIKRALISVSDKSGLGEFVNGLHEFGVEIISTGGTAKKIKKLGIPVKAVSDLTGTPEMFDGRVKTLHPKIHGALLALRDNPAHKEQIKKFGIKLIDMVVVNLYPFEKTVDNPNLDIEDAIENIDIGGPSMLRSAAKNSKSVAVVCNPQQYNQILDEMKTNNGSLTQETCFALGIEAFQRTNEYDRAIVAYFKSKQCLSKDSEIFPQTINLAFKKVQSLRYGENPHQQAAFYKEVNSSVPGIASAHQLHGKELSFNNILDLNAALDVVKGFEKPAAAIIKHTNPCGAAVAEKISIAYKDALACDRLSAFGSIVGFNRKVEQDTAEVLLTADFIECIIAPGFSEKALDMLKKKKNLRIIDIDNFIQCRMDKFGEFDFKRVNGGLLIENKDITTIDKKTLKTVTEKVPIPEEMESLVFAWKIAKHVKSNAIVLAQGTKTVGIGAGQMSRVDSVIIALRKAEGRSQGAVLASDAFFPKADAIEQAAGAKITAIIQPGGSIRDKEIIQAAESAGIAMIFTGMRHFKH